jgi:CheY-like chemotaxis protein
VGRARFAGKPRKITTRREGNPLPAWNSFAIPRSAIQTRRVTLPLAIVFYEDLMPGSQLVNRLQDLQYRVQAVTDPGELAACARSAGPMLILADLVSTRADTCALIKQLRSDPATAHVPVIAFADDAEEALPALARAAGATLVVADSAILTHLVQFIERALQVE